jgi:transcriptional regulator with XRE-family HTH domain
MQDQEAMRQDLRQFLTRTRMTQSELADRLGMRRGSLNRVLNGSQRISPEFVGKFFLAFPDEAVRIFGPHTHSQLQAVPA